MLLDRLSSLTACCSVGLGGRLQASGPAGRTSSASLNECRDRLLRSVAGASRWRPSDPRARERRWAAFTEIHLVRVRISFFSFWDRGISDRFSLLSGEEVIWLPRLSRGGACWVTRVPTWMGGGVGTEEFFACQALGLALNTW